MALNSKIDWTDHSWNPWVGCSKVSEGCANCYMFRDQNRFGNDPTDIRRTSKSTWNQVKKFKAGDKVFVCSWSDFFHPDVPEAWRIDAWQEMRDRDDVTWILLTKRPENIERMLPNYSDSFIDWDCGGAWQNVWLGVTAENQEQADRRIQILLQIPAAVRFVSVEPMLGPVDLYLGRYRDACLSMDGKKRQWLDWVICGGESGPGARPMQAEWARSLRDQCADAGVPFFFKQWGKWGLNWMNDDNGKIDGSEWMDKMGKKAAGRILDGRTWDQYPA